MSNDDRLPIPHEPSPFRGVTPVVDQQKMIDEAQTKAIAALDEVHTGDVTEIALLRVEVEELKRRVDTLEKNR